MGNRVCCQMSCDKKIMPNQSYEESVYNTTTVRKKGPYAGTNGDHSHQFTQSVIDPTLHLKS